MTSTEKKTKRMTIKSKNGFKYKIGSNKKILKNKSSVTNILRIFESRNPQINPNQDSSRPISTKRFYMAPVMSFRMKMLSQNWQK